MYDLASLHRLIKSYRYLIISEPVWSRTLYTFLTVILTIKGLVDILIFLRLL